MAARKRASERWCLKPEFICLPHFSLGQTGNCQGIAGLFHPHRALSLASTMPLLLHRFSKDRSSSKSLYRIPSFLLAPCSQHNVSGKPLESGFFSAQRIGVGKDNFAGFKKTQKGSTVKVAVMRRGYLCSEDNATCCTKGIH